ncbi:MULTISPECIES: hypothetical protein [unclassified Mammaliicoccus]|uniref:hypothetical protein n=1 Tax=unclassified Mammaliicoccus TaxID=2803851 RepID=UPI001EFACFF9|nr:MULTISPECIES: hypothetical protein [unclassified Mammaliicoccus]
MAYEYEELLIKQFNQAYRTGDLKQINLIKELKEVYIKAKALDKVITIVEDKEEFYSNEFIEAVVSAVDEFIDYELEDKQND